MLLFSFLKLPVVEEEKIIRVIISNLFLIISIEHVLIW